MNTLGCRYIPVLMGMARIYWDRGNYVQVEKIFRQSAEFASDHETWKLNVAHTFFMQVRAASAVCRWARASMRVHVRAPACRRTPVVCRRKSTRKRSAIMSRW